MVLTRGQKENLIEDLGSKLKRAKAAILANYRGMKVADLQVLRKLLREKQIDFKVVKNTLLKLAVNANNIHLPEEIFKKPLAIVFSYEDEVGPCKIVAQAVKNNANLEIIGGVIEKQFVLAQQIKILAALPGREELYAKIVGCCAAPISGLVNVLAGNLRGLVSVLQQYREKIS